MHNASLSCFSTRPQALGALRRGCGHHPDQAEGGQSLPQVPPAAPAADLHLCLLRVPGERHHAYVKTPAHARTRHRGVSEAVCAETVGCSITIEISSSCDGGAAEEVFDSCTVDAKDTHGFVMHMSLTSVWLMMITDAHFLNYMYFFFNFCYNYWVETTLWDSSTNIPSSCMKGSRIQD